MEVVAHNGVGQHIDAEDGSEGFHTSADPLATERKILAGDGINASQKCPSDAPLYGMHDRDFVGKKLIGPSGPTHGTPPRTRNDFQIRSARQGRRKQKVGGTFRSRWGVMRGRAFDQSSSMSGMMRLEQSITSQAAAATNIIPPQRMKAGT